MKLRAKHVISALCGCSLCLLLCVFLCGTTWAARRDTALAPVHLWDGTMLNAHRVTLTPYLPAHTAHPTAAIIVCPGGSYFWLASTTEGRRVAEWLQQNGIAAFVLHYRTAGGFAFASHDRLIVRGHRHPDMVQDAQRAIAYVRSHADALNVDTARVGIMGFSAGGHLATMTGAYAATNFLAPLGLTPTVSLRPNFIAALYPVVTLCADVAHRRSRRALLGEWGKANHALRDSLSLERHIHSDMPPVFLMNCKDDPIVHYHNAELLDSALTAAHVPHRYVQYATGGHGFGVSSEKTTAEAIAWKQEFLDWLTQIK